jgi:hypothetical protein
MLVFAAATQGFWLVKSRLWESLALVLIAFTLFRPGFWWDMVYPPRAMVDPGRLIEVVEALPEDGQVRLSAAGETIDGDFVNKTVMLPVGPAAPGAERLASAGVEIRTEGGKVLVDNLVFGSAAEQAGLDFDWEILNVEMEAERPPRQLMYIPALALLGLLGFIQLSRRRRADTAPAPA